VVSWGDDYTGETIPDPGTWPDLAAPALYWTPVISPSGMAVYQGDAFPAWRGSLLLGGLTGQWLIRVTVDPNAHAKQVDRWDMGTRIRNVAIGNDGTAWLLEDADRGHPGGAAAAGHAGRPG